MPLQDAISQVQIDIPSELFWGIIAGLLAILGWVIARYVTRLDTILERLDTAIESISNTLIGLGSEQSHIKSKQENHENRISKLEDVNKSKRR